MRKGYKMDQIPMPQPKELSGWKAIAAHLGVSARTAQEYEKNLGLPIHHQPGQKGRVFAESNELDSWRTRTGGNGALIQNGDSAAAAGTPQNSPEGSPSRPARRAWPRGFLTILTIAVPAIAGLAAGAYFLLIPHGPPSDFRVEGKHLIVVNTNGRELWRHTFDGPLTDRAYLPDSKLPLSWLGDLDGDGRRELVFVASPVNIDEVGAQVLCFAADGKIRWRFTPGRAVTDAGGERMVPPYFTSTMRVIMGKAPADTRIAVSSHHFLSQPNQVAFLDIHGRVVGEYWHPGHLLHSGTVDLDNDGRQELLLAGVNNGNHQATLVVLDPSKVVGLMTPKEMRDHRFELLDMPPAKERAVVFFPRSCLSVDQPYTRASELRIIKERLIVVVSEGLVEDVSPAFAYQLDYGLNVVDVAPTGVGVAQAHQAFEAGGKLDHPFFC